MPTIQVPALTQIEIDKVFQPFPDAKTWKDGAKRGAIKARVDGKEVKYQVKETMLKQFTDGETCQVEVRTFGDKADPGREIVKKVGWNGQAGIPKQNTKQRMDPADARGAFISLAFDAYVRAGKIPLNKDAIATARIEIGLGYDQSLSPQWRSDMNDEIPEEGWVNSENPAD